MELKKSKSANLEDKRLTYVLIGLVMSLSLIYFAFEWTESEIVVAEITDILTNEFEEELDIEQTMQEETPPPPEPEEIPEEVIEEITVVDDNKKVDATNFSSEDNQKVAQQIVQQPTIVEAEEEEEDKIFQVVEEQPSFPGGTEAMMKYFQSNIRYPVMAQEMGIQGKVICQFTVRKDGTVGDVVVLRSADKSLDAEAIRLVSKMPKWKPGKQRGKAVHCKFTVPVVFKLAH
ncbi:MAG: energy transducer TonB [Paludibacteraceae bacterium]|nr:energy transducer TonB [Paludibacteraceae bacterium]